MSTIHELFDEALARRKPLSQANAFAEFINAIEQAGSAAEKAARMIEEAYGKQERD